MGEKTSDYKKHIQFNIIEWLSSVSTDSSTAVSSHIPNNKSSLDLSLVRRKVQSMLQCVMCMMCSVAKFILYYGHYLS